MESEYEKINKGHVKIYLSQVGVKNFRFTIQSYVVVGCKLFLFRYQVVLLLKRTGWKGLTRHPKHRGKDNSNSRTNSLQPRENDAGQFTSRPVLVKRSYLVILISNE
jgi:hypothetical protein